MKKRIIYIAVLSVLLAACGGGKDDKASQPNPLDNNSGGNNTDTTTSSKITLDDTVPDATRTKIVEIVSPLGETSATGGTVATADQRSTVMALDKDSQIVMLGFAIGNQPTVLNAESTALGLVRLSMGEPKNLTDDELDTYIKKATGFVSLKESVEQVFNTGEPVSRDKTVIQQIIVIANQVIEQIEANKVQKTARVLPIEPSVKNPLPFKLITNDYALGSVTIDESKRVVNAIPLAWDMVAKDYQGNILPNGEMKLPAAVFGNRIATGISNWGLVGLIVGYFGSESLTVPDDKGRSFALNIAQTENTKITNISVILADLIAADLKLYTKNGSEKCAAEVVKLVMTGVNIEHLAKGTAEDFVNGFKLGTGTLSNAMKAHKISSECISVVGSSTDKIAKAVAPKLFLAYEVYKSLELAYKYGSIAERMFVLKKHWKTNETYTVCMGQTTGLLGSSSEVTNCAEDIEIKEKQAVIPTAGAEFNLDDFNYFDVIAKDKNGNRTLVPNKVVYQSSNPNIATIDNTGKIKTLKEGDTEITLFDETTGKKTKQPYKLTVYKPTFNKSEIKLAVGESVTLPLQNAKGQNITHNGLTQWGKSPTDIVYFSPELFTNKITGQTGIMIRGEKDGEADIVGNNLTDGNNVGLRVTVGDSNYTKISATGEKLPESAEDWNCVLDKETGLMWENKSSLGYNSEENYNKLRDPRNLYTWFENNTGYADIEDYSNPINNSGWYYGRSCNYTLNKCNTNTFIKAINSQTLCGYSNWRLPSKDELIIIGKKQDKNKFFFIDSFWSDTNTVAINFMHGDIQVINPNVEGREGTIPYAKVIAVRSSQ